MSIIGDLWMLFLGLAAGLTFPAYCFFRARFAEAELCDLVARYDTLREDRDAWRDEAIRLRNVLAGKHTVSVPQFPRPLNPRG